jgi:general secretion pathway protein D
MKVPSGQVVMLGGLMEDSLDKGAESLPGLEENAAAGLFGTRNSRVGKSELVIFLRPVVINDPSLDGDYAAARGRLPNENFFVAPPHWSANK